MNYAHLRLAGGMIDVSTLSGDLFEHLVKAHEDDRVTFNKGLELLNDGMKGCILPCAMFDKLDLFVEPGPQDIVVLRKPAANSVLNYRRRHLKMLFYNTVLRYIIRSSD